MSAAGNVNVRGRMRGTGLRRGRHRFAGRAVVFALVAACVLAWGPQGANAADASVFSLSPKLVPATGALFGVTAGPRDGRTWEGELEYLEAKIGRRFALDRRFYRWDADFPGAYEQWTVSQGRIPLLSWAPVTLDGRYLSWSKIANGAYDPVIRARARVAKAFGHRFMLIFIHEANIYSQPPADFVAAWKRVVTIFRQERAWNVVWVWTMTAHLFQPGGKNPDHYYPGNSYVDWIAADAYNWYGSWRYPDGRWRSFEEILTPFYKWAKGRGKPLAVPEYASLEDWESLDPLRRAQWFADVGKTVKKWPEMKAISYFNQFGWWFDTNADGVPMPHSLAAFAALGHDPHFNP